MSSHRTPVIAATIAFAVCATAGGAIVWQGERLRTADQRQAVAEVAAGSAFALEREISRTLSSTYALAAVVRQRGEPDDFDALAAAMLPAYGPISSLQLAPGAVVRRIHPAAGNEAAIGHDLLRDPDRRFQARAAVESRQLVVAGPFALKQGGVGLVGRLAVFVPDAAAPGGERFWGLVSAVVKLDDLLTAAGVSHLHESGYAWELSALDAGTAYWRRVGGGGELRDGAVEQAVEVPGGAWRLRVVSRGPATPPIALVLQYALALVGTAAVAIAVFLGVRQPLLLRREVAARTAELSETNARLAGDVAERVRAEAALALTHAVVDRAVFAVAWADEDGRVVWANRAFAQLGRVAPEDLARRPLADVLPSLGPDGVRALVRELEHAPTAATELRIGEGHRGRHARLVVERVRVAERLLLVLFAWDVTAQREAEEQLRQAQKMDAIGQLAGGIAHDFNNLLTGILGHASVVLELAPEGSEIRESAATISQAGLRAAELTRQLLGFARHGALRTAPVDVHAIAREVSRLLARTVDKRIRIVERLAAAQSTVVADAGQLQQALLNLAVNARDAMPDGGELALESAVVELDARWCERHPATSPGPHLAITVADTGQGIAPEIAQRMFEPFFTTKPAGRGTGMGLAMVYGIARDHRGAVEVASVPGEGARFTLLLPLATEATSARAPAAAAPVRGDGRVRVVDDDDVPREAAARMLRGLGYDVVTLGRGEDAVRWLAERGQGIRAVLLDLNMPGLDGMACFQALRAIDPVVRVVITSGSARDGRLSALLDAGADGFVEKPFGIAELAEAIAAPDPLVARQVTTIGPRDDDSSRTG
jgi:two-component system, cell cycle sensor histidine kinase and response regulator CckA